MTDWRWVTQVQSVPSPGNVLPPTTNGMWINFDSVDTIMPLTRHDYRGAHTRLGWLRDHWHYIFVAEQIAPSTEGENTNHNNPQKEESNAGSEMEPNH